MLKLYNSLTSTIDEFRPYTNNVTIYVCGITPYDTTHLGHAFTYLSFDVLIRYLKYKKFEVNYTQNVTDINDRDKDILERARQEGRSWQDLSEFWTSRFLDDMGKLNWTVPNNYLFASKQIPQMTDLIQKIVNNGYGYIVNNNVYLDIKKFQNYGKLSKFTENQMIIRAKEFEEDLDNKDKKHPLDITLWKGKLANQPEHIPFFDSIWGPGRPGWHLECSAMAVYSLGETIDIHGGGIDLIYPHHESEIAQSESATGKSPFAKFWIHTQTVEKDNKKMSKSLGNLIMVSDLLKTFSPNTIRWFLLSHHYRKPWNYDEKDLILINDFLVKIKEALKFADRQKSEDIKIKLLWETFLDEDLQVWKVLESMKTVAEDIVDKKVTNRVELANTLFSFYQMLGFTLS